MSALRNTVHCPPAGSKTRHKLAEKVKQSRITATHFNSREGKAQTHRDLLQDKCISGATVLSARSSQRDEYVIVFYEDRKETLPELSTIGRKWLVFSQSPGASTEQGFRTRRYCKIH